MNVNRRAWVLPILATCIVMAGCGGETRQSLSKVSGTVYLDDKPHGPARLTLTPVSAGSKDTRSTIGGEVDPSGKYTLTTYDQGDGAPPGKYTITLAAGGADPASTDPAAMMQLMGGSSAAPLMVDIPAEATDKFDLKFVSSKQTGPADPTAPIGTAPMP